MRMDLSLSALPDQIQIVGEQIYSQVVDWYGYTVRLISSASPYLQTTLRATLALICLNIAFFELSVAICKIMVKLIDCYDPYKNLPDDGYDKILRSLGIGTLFVICSGSANHQFQKMLRLPLATWKIVSIGVVTDMIWLIYKSWK